MRKAKRFGKILIITTLVCALFASTVSAAPTVNELKEDKKKAQKELKTLQEDMTTLMSKINKAEKEMVEVGKKIIKAEGLINYINNKCH